MGATAQVTVVGGAAYHLDYAVARLAELDRRWNRFLPDNELSRLDASGGEPTLVSRDTFELVALAVESWHTTGGRYDPTGPTGRGCDDIRLCAATSTITVPAGLTLDLDGITRGRATDLVATELVGRGARGARVDLGDALRAVGGPPNADGWLVEIDAAAIAIPDGAVATSNGVTVMADEAWRAVVLADAAHRGMPVDHALVVAGNGRVTWTGALEPFLV